MYCLSSFNNKKSLFFCSIILVWNRFFQVSGIQNLRYPTRFENNVRTNLDKHEIVISEFKQYFFVSNGDLGSDKIFLQNRDFTYGNQH